MTGCPSKLVPIGFELPQGGFLKSHRPLSSYLPLSILLPAHPSHYIGPRIGLASPLEHWPWKAHDVTMYAHDVIHHYGRFWETVMAIVARVAAWRSPRRANVLLQEANAALKRANVTLERA
jgi:hypothetical protein